MVRTQTLYEPSTEHDSCGFGLIANLDNRPSRWLVETALSSLARMSHRGAILADEVGLGKTIEAGIVLAQRWAERRRHILLIDDVLYTGRTTRAVAAVFEF